MFRRKRKIVEEVYDPSLVAELQTDLLDTSVVEDWTKPPPPPPKPLVPGSHAQYDDSTAYVKAQIKQACPGCQGNGAHLDSYRLGQYLRVKQERDLRRKHELDDLEHMLREPLEGKLSNHLPKG